MDQLFNPARPCRILPGRLKMGQDWLGPSASYFKYYFTYGGVDLVESEKMRETETYPKNLT